MDVRLPDGSIVRNVPDGTTKAELMAKLAANGYDVGKIEAPAKPKPKVYEREGGATGTWGTGGASGEWTEPAGRGTRFLQGIKDPALGAVQLVANVAAPKAVAERVNDYIRDDEYDYQVRRAAAGSTGLDAYRLVGNVLNPANAAIAARLPQAMTLAGRLFTGGLGGGLSALLNPVTAEGSYAENKGEQVALGAAFGGAATGATNALARIISPKASTDPALAALRAEGIRPTVGQTLGGAVNATEQKLASLPIAGDAIAGARRRAVEDFNLAAINRATAPIGVKVKKAGHEGVQQAGDALSAAYNDVLGKVKSVQLDPQFTGELAQLQQMTRNLVPAMRDKFDATLADIVSGRLSPAKAMTGEVFKKVDSELGGMAARYARSSTASEGELGDALRELQRMLREQVARSNPQQAKQLAAINDGWANLVRVEGAAKAAANNEGVFSPAQLMGAIKAGDSSVRKRAVSRGDARMQDLAGSAQSTIGNHVPDSGTAGRLWATGGAGYFVDPLIPLGLAAAAGIYSRPAQNALSAVLGTRPVGAQPAAEALQRIAPVLVPAAAQLGLRFPYQ